MRKIPEHAAPAIASELSVLSGAARSFRVRELASQYAASEKTINSIARKYGQRARAQRSDSGCTDCPMDIILRVASLALVGLNLKGQFTNGIKQAMRMLEHEGVRIPITYSRMCQLLREKGYSRADLAARDPHREMLSLYPNHVWQFDVSNCHQWHLDNKGIKDLWDFELHIYKNKAQEHFKDKRNARQIRRYVIIDHCSGAFYFEYFYAEGERAEDGAKFFYNAFADKADMLENALGVLDSPYQFAGVPEILVSDKGSILQKGLIKSLMANLGVKTDLHQAGAPWSKGAVEGLMNIIGTHFEPLLKINRPKSLEELNQWALAWCIDYNNAKEFRDGTGARIELWHKGIRGHLRNCPNYQVYTSLQQTVPEERTVTGAGLISYDGNAYYVPNPDAPKRKVFVQANAYTWPAVTIKCPWDGTVFEDCPPLEKDDYGRYISPANAVFGTHKGLHKTKRQYARETLEAVATEGYGTVWKGNKAKRQATAPEAAPLSGALSHVLTAAAQIDTPKLPLAGSDIALPDISAPVHSDPKVRPMRSMAAPAAIELVPIEDIIRLYVQTHGRRITPALRASLVSAFPDGADAALTLDEILTIAGGFNAQLA